MALLPTKQGICDGCGESKWLYHWVEKLRNEQGHIYTRVHKWYCWVCLPRWKK